MLYPLFYLILLALLVPRHVALNFHAIILKAPRQSKLSFAAGGDKGIRDFEDSWISRDITAKNIRISDFKWSCGDVRGLKAVQPISRGQEVIRLPLRQTLIASEAASSKDSPKGLESVWSDIKGTTRVSLSLLLEWDKSDSSIYREYIDALPRPGEAGTPFHWPEEFLNDFPYRPLVNSVKRQKEQWAVLFERIKKLPLYSNVSYERFVWAMEMVRSRAFQGIGGISSNAGADLKTISAAVCGALIGAALVTSQLMPTTGEAAPIVLGSLGMLSLLPAVLQSKQSSCVLLPVIDSCNHKGTGAVGDVNFDPSKGAFVVQATRDISVDEQVTISYGNRDNDDLLQYFGFVEENCEFDRFVVNDPITVLQQSILLKSSDAGATLTKLQPSLLVMLESLQKSSAGSTGKTASASNGVIVVNKGSTSSWSLGQLLFLLQDDKEGTNNNISTEEALRNGVINKSLRAILVAEKDRLGKAKSEYAASAAVSSGDDSIRQRSCLVDLFLAEKITVIESALARI